MADLGKNGYQWTGYTEPFIVPPGQTVTAASLAAQTLGGDTIPNSVSANSDGATYTTGTYSTVSAGDGEGLTIEITDATAGAVVTATIVNAGSGYYNGETVTVVGGDGNGTVDIVDAALPAASVPIQYSEFRNSGLYIRAYADAAASTTFTSKDLNFDTRMSNAFPDVGQFIISDDDGATFVTVDGILYNNVTGLYTVTVSAAIDVSAGQTFPVVARKLDVGVSTGAQVTAGQLCVRAYVAS